MKKQFALAAFILLSLFAAAQDSLPVNPYFKTGPYFKSYKDYLLPKTGAPTTGTAVPPEMIINTIRNMDPKKLRDLFTSKTPSGTINNLPPDNMPVLSPDMSLLARMPGSSRKYTPAPPSAMPNPLYPGKKDKTAR